MTEEQEQYHLIEIGGQLDPEGTNTALYGRNHTLHTSILTVLLDNGTLNPPPLLYNFMFIGGIGTNETDRFDILQSYCVVSTGVKTNKVKIMESLVCRANEVMPIGHFGVLESEGEVYWRQCNVIDTEQKPKVALSGVALQAQLAINLILDFKKMVEKEVKK